MSVDQDQYSYIQVSMPGAAGVGGSGHVVLAKLVNAQKIPLVCMKQLNTLVCPQATPAAFRNGVARVANPTLKQATPVQIFQLKQMQALLPSASVCQLGSVDTACRVVQTLGVSRVVVQSLRMQTPYEAVPSLPPQNKQPTLCAASGSLSTTTGLPTSLPKCPISGQQLKADYGLLKCKPQLARATPLSHHVKQLEAWLREPVQTDRPGKCLSSQSWAGVQKLLYMYLGFIHKFHGVQLPTLPDFLNANLIMHYIGFCQARGLVADTVKLYLMQMVCIIQYLQAKQGSSLRMQELLVWVATLKKQLRHAFPQPKKDPVDLLEQGKAAPPGVLLAHLEAKRLKVLDLVKSKGRCFEAAKANHDWCMVACLFGWLPPLRSSCIRTLMHPTNTQGCLDADCTASNCKGNCLTYTGDKLRVLLTHHKNAGSWGDGPIRFYVPKELASMLQLHLQWGLDLLVNPHGEEGPWVFVTPTGKQLQQHNLQTILNNMLKELGVTIPAHTLRHTFVEERKSTSRVQGPEDAGAAMVMGHSTRQWTAGSYDRHFSRREAQLAVDNMRQWREGVLAQEVANAKAAALATGAGAWCAAALLQQTGLPAPGLRSAVLLVLVQAPDTCHVMHAML
jgi:hypothetical protein